MRCGVGKKKGSDPSVWNPDIDGDGWRAFSIGKPDSLQKLAFDYLSFRLDRRDIGCVSSRWLNADRVSRIQHRLPSVAVSKVCRYVSFVAFILSPFSSSFISFFALGERALQCAIQALYQIGKCLQKWPQVGRIRISETETSDFMDKRTSSVFW